MKIDNLDIMRLDLNLLVTFDALMEERSVSAVARRLQLSQPTISFALAKLRSFFSDDLFVRTGAGMRPTPYSTQLHGSVRDVLELIRLEILKKPAFEPPESTRRFAICASDIGSLVFVPGILERLARDAPNATLQCLSYSHHELGRAMEDGVVDLSIGYFPDLISPGIRSELLFEHPFICLVRKNNPKVSEILTLTDFMAMDHLVVRQEGRSQEIFERTMASNGLARPILLQLPHFTSVPHILATSDMITTVPRMVGVAFAEKFGLRMLEPPIEIPQIEVRLFWHRRAQNDPALVWLRSVVSEHFCDGDPTRDQ